MAADRAPRTRALAERSLSVAVAAAVAVAAFVALTGDATSNDQPAIEIADIPVVDEQTVVSAPRQTRPPLPAVDPDTPAEVAQQTTTTQFNVVGGVARTGGFTDLIQQYFGAATLEAIVIVQCESEFVPDALNTNTDGTQDHGLFQINDVHMKSFEPVTGYSWDDRYDPVANVAFASWLYHRAGWKPWRCNIRLDPADHGEG